MSIRRGRGWFGGIAAARLVVWLVSGAGAAAWGQAAVDGAVGGRVVGAQGAPVAGVRVGFREEETGLAAWVRSGAHGEFLAVRLPMGEYAVTVENAGAVATLSEPVAVEVGDVTEIEVRLGMGAAPSSWVSRAPSLKLGATVGDLPTSGGDWRPAALAAYGGEATNADGDESIRGIDSTQNSERLDGASADESFSGLRAGAGGQEEADSGSDEVYDRAAGAGSGPRSVADAGERTGSAYAFSQAAVREFRVGGQADAAAYGSALYGHGVGGVVTTVSRSGGETLRGMAFYTVRDGAWGAANPFAVASTYVNGVTTSGEVKPMDLRQQYGGSLGGPVRWRSNGGAASSGADEKPKLFFFYACDGQRRNFPAISSPGYAGFYRLTAMQTALLADRSVTSAETSAALNYLNGLTGTVARQANQTVNFGRLDWQRRGGNRLALEYNRVRWDGPGAGRSGAVVNRGVASLGSSFGRIDAGVVRWVQFLTTGLSNEVRAQVGRELRYETAEAPLAQEPNVGPGGMPPEVSIGPDGFVFGTPASLGQRAYPDERRMEVAEVLAWVKGRQFVQLGGDFSLLSDRTESLTNVDGTFSYDSGVTGGKAGGLVDWITDYTYNVHAYPNGGCPWIGAEVHNFCFRSYSQSFGQQNVSFSTQEWAGFVQDDWRLAQRLTLHAGVRYEYEFLPLPQQPNAALDAVFGAVGATSIFPEDRNNFGPRLGVEWAPFGAGRGVVRAGYGVYFGKLPGATIQAVLLDTAMPSSVMRVRVLPTTETVCPQDTQVEFGYACSFLAQPNGTVASTTSAVVFDRRFRLPMAQQASLDVEHAVGWGVLGSARYEMNLDRQLPNSVDINIAPSKDVQEFELQGGTGTRGVRSGETFTVPVYTARVTTGFGPVTDVISNANATYNGLTLEARRGLGGRAGMGGIGRGLEFRAGWTWSKAIDYGQSGGSVPRTNGQFDPFTLRYDKGLSALNFPHRVVATVVWSPRVTAGDSDVAPAAERIVWRVAEGWSMAAIFSEGSGRGYSYSVFGGSRLAGGHESINGSGGSVVLPTVGRNTLRLPDSANLDLRLSRSFRLGETLHLRAAAEIFNVTNHVNISSVTQRAFLVGTPGTGIAPTGVTPLVFQDAATVASEGLNVLPFGAYTASGINEARERQVQFGLRLEF